MRLTHAEAQALISARLDGPLDPVAERELNAHLATCDSCRAFNASAGQLARGLQNMPYLPASPAVSRAVLEHISQPRSPWSSFFGSMPHNALPVASAIAAAVIIVFIGAFTLFRVLGFEDDQTQTPPGTTETSNLAQRPDETPTQEADSTETTLQAPTEAPSTSQPTDQSGSTDEPAQGAVPTGETDVPETEPDRATEPAQDASATETAPDESEQATEPASDTSLAGATDEPAATELPEIGPPESTGPDQGRGGAEADSTPNESQAFLRLPDATPTAEPTATQEPAATATAEPTESPEPTATATDAPTATPEPSNTPTEEPTATEAPTETPEPTATAEPTSTPQPTPTATTEPTATPTESPIPTETPAPTQTPTELPTETPEPTATTEPTATPTDVPTDTPEPTATPTDVPTEVPTATAEPTAPPEPTTPTGPPTSPPIEPRDGQVTDPDDNEEQPTAVSSDGLQTPEDGTDPDLLEPPTIASTDDTPESGDDSGQTILAPEGEGESTPIADESLPADTGSGDAGQGGAGSRSLADGEIWSSLSDIPGDGNRLGFSPAGDLIFSTNPGRVSLEQNGITLQPSGSGQGVNACDQSGSCVDITSLGGDTGGYEDYPLGWIGAVAIYERANGDTYPLEFHAVTLDAGNQPIDDHLIGGGEANLATLIRPYPSSGGLLVPTPDSWLLITTEAMQVIDDNPYGPDLGQIRFDPNGGAIAYVTGGTLIRASLSEPGTPLVQIPYRGEDYDFSPNGDRVAVRIGDTIEIMGLDGTVQATYTGDGHTIGSLVWANQGLFYVDTTDGVLRVIQP